MKSKDNGIVDTPTKAVELLWRVKYFEDWRPLDVVGVELSQRKYNFPKDSLSKALQRDNYLTRREKGKGFEYIQKYPAPTDKPE